MKFLSLPAVLLFSSPTSSTTVKQEPLCSTLPSTKFRHAQVSDLSDIVTVLIDAFAPSEANQYIYQEWPKYRNYTIHCTTERFRKQNHGRLPEGILANVITVPRSGPLAEGQPEDRAVSIGFWKSRDGQMNETAASVLDLLFPASASPTLLGVSDDDSQPPYNCSLSLGTNTTRAEHHSKTLHAFEEDLLSRYKSTLYLAVLATHPDWDGHGFAARHLAWGKEIVRNESLSARDVGQHGKVRPITLFATPAGYPLYASEGFEKLKNVTVERIDRDGPGFWYEGMVWQADKRIAA